MTDGTRHLAAQLAALDDDALVRLLAARRIPEAPGWRSFFDAADALLAQTAVETTVLALPGAQLEALADAQGEAVSDAARGPLAALALVDASGHPYPAVLRALEPWIRARADIGPPSADVPPPAAASDSEDALAAERVFTNSAALADLLLRALRTPLTRIGSGAVGAAERRRLAEDLPHPDDLDALVELAERSDLLRGEDRLWLPTETAEEWLRLGTPERWAVVATAWEQGLPEGVRLRAAPPRGWRDPAYWVDAYPADAGWPARATRLLAQAEAWGLLTATGNQPTWAAHLNSGEGSASEALRAVVPYEVDRVYLQNDLSAIAPGPLAPALDVRLRSMAQRESHAQASSYRFSADSLGAALADGETQDSILSFLAEVSLTGVPQPLDYLVRQISRRHGSIRVATHPSVSGSRVTSDEDGLLDTLAVDQTLSSLGFVRRDTALESRVGREAVLWTLIDSGYPAVAVDAADRVLRISRHRLAGAATPPPPVRYADLVETLRAADPADADAAWLVRELEAAVRDRAEIELDVAMPDGSSRAFRLEATGFGGGRIRGRDLGADVERTLPVSLIRTLRRS